MKTLTTLLMLAPGTVLAHGGHAHFPVGAHEAFHAGPWLAVGLIVGAVVLSHIRGQDE